MERPQRDGPLTQREDETMTKFDTNTLRELRDLQEVYIRTEMHPKSAVVIWVVVVDDEVFVRSWLGAKGRWYGDLAAGGPGTLEYGGRRLAVQAFSASDPEPVVRAFSASDPEPVVRASREFLRKYQRSRHAQ